MEQLFKNSFSVGKFQKDIDKNKKKAVKVVNPIFLQYMEKMSDPFWQDIAKKASEGKFPKGFYYKNNILGYRNRNINETFNLSNDPIQGANEFVYVIKRNSLLKSNADSILEKEIAKKLDEVNTFETKINSWKELKSKKLKELYVERYINKATEELKLNSKQRRRLFSLINIGIFNEYLTNNEIKIKDNEIIAIDGILVDNINNEFDFHFDYSVISDRMEKKTKNYSKNNDINDSKKFFTIKFDEKYLHTTNYDKVWNNFLSETKKRRGGEEFFNDIDDSKSVMSGVSLNSLMSCSSSVKNVGIINNNCFSNISSPMSHITNDNQEKISRSSSYDTFSPKTPQEFNLVISGT